MNLKHPFIITARLLPGLKIGTAFISIETTGTTSEGRTRYRYHIDAEGFEYSNEDLKSGCGGGSVEEGMTSLLSFLDAAAESAGHYMRTGSKGDNFDLFPDQVTQWAYNHSDEIAMLQCEIEESDVDLITA